MFKLLLGFIFTLMGLCSYSQREDSSEKFPFESKNYFDLKGNVLSAEITVTKDHFNSYQKISNTTVLRFNKDGYLLKKYETYGDSIIILTEENVFNNNNQLIHKTEYSRKQAEINNKMVFTMELADYQTKYSYNSEGKLLTKHEKSHREKDFFLTKRYRYENNLLKEELAINHHFGPNRMEWISDNYLIKYTYEGLVVKQQKYKYEGKGYNRYVKDGIEQFELIIQDEKTLDTSKFVLESERRKEYNQANQLIIQEANAYLTGNDSLHTMIAREYFGTKLSKYTGMFDDKYITVNNIDYHILNKTIQSYDYQIILNDTLISSETLAFKYEASDDLEIRSISKYEYNADGSYIKFNFDKDMLLGSTENYNVHGHLIENRNAQNELTEKYNYQYDTRGNWIYKQWVSLPDEREIELIERKIKYFN